jgi:4-amino-4-deoxy-L-arabinose transferase-like glycosyltransferase
MINNQTRPILIIALLGLILRLILVFSTDLALANRGGDTNWLLYTGRALVTGTIREPPQPGPVYLVYTGLVQITFGEMIRLPEDEPDIVKRFQAVQIVRSGSWQVLGILNAIAGAALAVLVWLIGRRWLNARAGLIAAGLIAFNPIFIIESINLYTESLFLVLFFGALALYAAHDAQTPTSGRVLFLVGALLGLTTLTRAVTLLFPAVIVLHLIIEHRRAAGRLIVALIIGYALALSPWTVYNLVKWNRVVIGAEGIIANIFIGTLPAGWQGPQATDNAAGIDGSGNNQEKYSQGAFAAITGDPVGYVRRRVGNLLEAALQPHNTVYYPGESIKQLFSAWWSRGRNLSEIGALTNGENFWQKLLLYIFHFGALIGGVIGMVIGLRRFGARFILYGTIGYFLALHLVLTAIPRYLFPIEPMWLLFAAFVIAGIAGRRATAGAASTG